ncbi:Iron-sulfur cluster repair protein YtfE [bioreactor metagenome]|uniref:Iron-sulfur cluster repair protein YtfE n=1 Tax=bioreactor metagenome TaxID=1076179 RepID=A0A644SUM3_9ZZZZ
MFTKNDKIGFIVVEFPKAAEIFKKYQIDFCCGGDRPLDIALTEQKLDADEVLQQLNSAYNEYQQLNAVVSNNWLQASLADLVDYIVVTHHKYLDANLPGISELTLKILRVHGGRHQELGKVHKLFNVLRTELEEHLITEETILFPLIKQYEQDSDHKHAEQLKQLIQTIENEHEAAGDIIKELRAITGGFTPPEDACTSYKLTYKRIEELESDLFQHIHLENNILHPRVKESI